MSHPARSHSEKKDQTPNMDGFPRFAIALVNEYMAELDDIWPFWRECRPLTPLEFLHRARVKWLLKRISLLSHRENGTPVPRNWEVHITPSRTDPKECFAHPIWCEAARPKAFWVPPKLGELPPVLPSASALAVELRLPLERVEALLPMCPPDADVREWLPDAVRRTGGVR